MVNSQFFRQSPSVGLPPSALCRRLLNYKRRDLIWSGSWTMDNAVSRLDNGELKQGVRFVMRRHTRAPLPHAPSPCHLPPATSRQRVAVLAKMRAGVAKQILLLFNCNQIISTRFLRPLYSLSVLVAIGRRQGALVVIFIAHSSLQI